MKSMFSILNEIISYKQKRSAGQLHGFKFNFLGSGSHLPRPLLSFPDFA